MKGSKPVGWDALIPYLVHPHKVLVIEAMFCIDRPMSAIDFEHVFEGKISLSTLSYHIKILATLGVLTLTDEQRVRGARKKLYFFTAAADG